MALRMFGSLRFITAMFILAVSYVFLISIKIMTEDIKRRIVYQTNLANKNPNVSLVNIYYTFEEITDYYDMEYNYDKVVNNIKKQHDKFVHEDISKHNKNNSWEHFFVNVEFDTGNQILFKLTEDEMVKHLNKHRSKISTSRQLHDSDPLFYYINVVSISQKHV